MQAAFPPDGVADSNRVYSAGVIKRTLVRNVGRVPAGQAAPAFFPRKTPRGIRNLASRPACPREVQLRRTLNSALRFGKNAAEVLCEERRPWERARVWTTFREGENNCWDDELDAIKQRRDQRLEILRILAMGEMLKKDARRYCDT